MIKINLIGSYGKLIPIADIEQQYLKKVKTFYNPLTNLQAMLNSGHFNTAQGPIPLTQDQINCLNYIILNFDNIIIAQPQDLQNHINIIDNTLFGNLVFKGRFGYRYESTPFGKAILELFAYATKFRTKANKGLWLAKKLDIKCCPYCNCQYTLVISKNSKAIIAKFQFDHFFNQKRYPYLSISLYNLIPSCAQCNLSKGDLETSINSHYHPYHNNIASISNFKLKYVPNITAISIGEIKNLNLTVLYRSKYPEVVDFVKRHNEIYEIEHVYNRHNDIIEDLLYKGIVNNKAFQKDIMKIKGLFNGDKTLFKRYLIGTYIFEGEILQRPLSKFIQDIAKQIKLI